MRRLRLVALGMAGLVIGASAAALHASDRVVVYALVDRVVHHCTAVGG
ncbi:MAG TPA: hypothetical protein VEL79_20150 [Vicinamibacterales bacterium]|nr:hypothetical protein [Vicinamibacterales bacterium]